MFLWELILQDTVSILSRFAVPGLRDILAQELWPSNFLRHMDQNLPMFSEMAQQSVCLSPSLRPHVMEREDF